MLLTLQSVVGTPFSDLVGYSDGKLHVVSTLRTEIELSIAVDGRMLSSIPTDGTATSAAGQDVFIGGHPSVDDLAFEGSIAEIVLARDLSIEEARSLNQTLVSKYADAL